MKMLRWIYDDTKKDIIRKKIDVTLIKKKDDKKLVKVIWAYTNNVPRNIS